MAKLEREGLVETRRMRMRKRKRGGFKTNDRDRDRVKGKIVGIEQIAIIGGMSKKIKMKMKMRMMSTNCCL